MKKIFIISLVSLIVSAESFSNVFMSLNTGYGHGVSIANKEAISLQAKGANSIMSPGAPKVLDFSIDGYSVETSVKQDIIPLAFLLGYRCNGLRHAIELGFRQHKVESKVAGSGVLSSPANITSGILLGATFKSNPDPIVLKVKSGDDSMQLLTVMAKTFYDFKINKIFTTYVGVGAGVGVLKYQANAEIEEGEFSYIASKPGITIESFVDYDAKSLASKLEQKLFVGQAILGLSAKINKQLSVSLEYQYTQSTKIKKPIDKAYASHTAMFGIVYDFL